MKNGDLVGLTYEKWWVHRDFTKQTVFWWEFRNKHADFAEKDGEPVLVGGLEHGNFTKKHGAGMGFKTSYNLWLNLIY